jgi:hypothetical protein
MEIYHDNGAAMGLRTRVFRNAAHGGVEWMYAADYASQNASLHRWYHFGPGGNGDIQSLKLNQGMFLSRLD